MTPNVCKIMKASSISGQFLHSNGDAYTGLHQLMIFICDLDESYMQSLAFQSKLIVNTYTNPMYGT